MKDIKIVGNFVSLESLHSSHLSDLEECFSETLFNHYPRPYFSAREFVEENFALQTKGEIIPFAIIHRSLKKAIGCTEFLNIDSKNRKLEIGGTWIGSQFQGLVFNTESKLLLLTHAFEVMNCVRVEFKTDSLNTASQQALEKMGAKREGILRNHMIRANGSNRHSVFFSIIAEEWKETKQHLLKRMELKLSR